MSEKPPQVRRRRPILGLIAILLLIFTYRVFAVYTVRSGECAAKPVDPSLRRLTRTTSGVVVSYPERTNFPRQQRPLVVMTYNIAGHDELYDSDHLEEIARTINSMKPDIVGLQEVHRKTWQARFDDQLASLEKLTGLRGVFGASYKQGSGGYGNAVLTRGTIRSADIHELPTVGEPRSVLETTIELDGATINFYVTHLSSWAGLNSAIRGEQLECLARHVRTSRWPYILVGDLNQDPRAPEIVRFRKENAAQICGPDLGPTHATMNKRLDYIFADWGWDVRNTRVLATGASDHWPVVSEMMWEPRAR